MSRFQPVYIKSDLPEGQSGDWVLERFFVPEITPEQQQADCRPDWAKSPPGVYTRLRQFHEDFMTDLFDEWSTQKIAMEQALERGGSVLTTGLGLGMLVESILRTPGCSVEKITVIEQSPDVIRLVAPHLQAKYGERLEIINADAFCWQIPSNHKFSVVWHDIWPNPAAPQVAAEMTQLHQHYQKHCEWQGCWAREFQTMSRRR